MDGALNIFSIPLTFSIYSFTKSNNFLKSNRLYMGHLFIDERSNIAIVETFKT